MLANNCEQLKGKQYFLLLVFTLFHPHGICEQLGHMWTVREISLYLLRYLFSLCFFRAVLCSQQNPAMVELLFTPQSHPHHSHPAPQCHIYQVDEPARAFCLLAMNLYKGAVGHSCRSPLILCPCAGAPWNGGPSRVLSTAPFLASSTSWRSLKPGRAEAQLEPDNEVEDDASFRDDSVCTQGMWEESFSK
jgi:hypothetical protein